MNAALRPPSYRTLELSPFDGKRWEVLKDWTYRGAREDFVVPKGFVTDLASVPWLLRLFFPQSGRYTAAAVLHDFLYSTHEIDRKAADRVFYRVMVEDEEGLLRAWLMYRAVRWFGWIAWRKGH